MANPVPVARVSAVQGQVFAKAADGSLRPLRVGDLIYDGESIVTGDGSFVDLAALDGQALTLGANETLVMDAEVLGQSAPDATDAAVKVGGEEFNRIVTALNEGQSLDALLEETAAGASSAGVGAGGGPTFVRLLRIGEGIDPLGYEFGTPSSAEILDLINGGDRPYLAGPPSITAVDENDSDGSVSDTAFHNTVSERGLTSAGDTSETAAGAILVSAPRGLVSVAIGDTIVTAAQLAALGTSPQSIDTGEGTLTLTGYHSATGVLSYQYTLKEAQTHSATGADSILDNIPLTITDLGGESSSGTLVINIVDDVPRLVNDTGSVTEDTQLTTTGKVLANDDLGADNANAATAVTGVVYNGQSGVLGQPIQTPHGTLTLQADGSYAYQLDNTAAQSLAAGQKVPYVFTYTVKDADGDTATATLTVTVTGTNDAPEISVRADDSASAGLTETNAALTASGTLSIYDVDTTDTVTVAKTGGVQIGGSAAGMLPGGLNQAALLAMFSVAGGEPSTTAQDNPHGITWKFDSGTQAFDFIPEGEILTLTYTVRANDGHGGYDDQQVTITLTGTNDGIRLVDDVAGTPEDTTVKGNVLTNDILDPDYGEKTVVTQFRVDADGNGVDEAYEIFADTGTEVTIYSASGGTLGTFTLEANGAYTFVP
ncbi:MAG: retention module-containing protein, partial [Candidatus Accumulibacter sp.]|nr:retention module-containing protein [Accumulibacter sp.]